MNFRWDDDKRNQFVTTLRKLQAEGDIDPNLNKSEAIRAVLEHWAENPDPDVIEQ